MPYDRIVISSGHGLYVRGASGVLDEVDEARLVVEALADELRIRGIEVVTFHDNTSKDQSTNLNTIVNAHNRETRDLDISVHFNAYVETTKPMGCEVLYVSQQTLAADLSAAIADVGFIDRGAKKRTDLFFLNNTEMPAVLLEVCFVDSDADAEIYREQFGSIIDGLAFELTGITSDIDTERPPRPDRPQRPPPDQVLFHAVGPCSYFGGPEDNGVSDDEGLAFLSDVQQAPQLFLPEGTPGTDGMGLARRLNPFVHYVACRWDYSITPKSMLAEGARAMVRGTATGREALAFPADWGPHESTGRVADLSPGLCEVLGVETDDEVEVIYPWTEDAS